MALQVLPLEGAEGLDVWLIVALLFNAVYVHGIVLDLRGLVDRHVVCKLEDVILHDREIVLLVHGGVLPRHGVHYSD